MAESDGSIKRRMEDTDKHIASPEARARHVFNILKTKAPELTQWDLVCFSAEFLGMQSAAYPWLRENSIALCKLIYHAHYIATEGVDRESSLRNTSEQPQREHEGNSDRSVGTSITIGGRTTRIGSTLHIHDHRGEQGEDS